MPEVQSRAMTITEREDFKELRAEMRDGFHQINEAVIKATDRIGSLELYRAAEQALDAERKTIKTDTSTERRWRLGISATVLITLVVTIVNLLKG